MKSGFRRNSWGRNGDYTVVRDSDDADVEELADETADAVGAIVSRAEIGRGICGVAFRSWRGSFPSRGLQVARGERRGGVWAGRWKTKNVHLNIFCAMQEFERSLGS